MQGFDGLNFCVVLNYTATAAVRSVSVSAELYKPSVDLTTECKLDEGKRIVSIKAREPFEFSWAIKHAPNLSRVLLLSQTQGSAEKGDTADLTLELNSSAIIDHPEGDVINEELLFHGHSNNGTTNVSISPISISIHVKALPSVRSSLLFAVVYTGRGQSKSEWPVAQRLDVTDHSRVELCVVAKDDSHQNVTDKSVAWLELSTQDRNSRDNMTKLEKMLYREGQGFCLKALNLGIGTHTRCGYQLCTPATALLH